jgi:hypothetical protein
MQWKKWNIKAPWVLKKIYRGMEIQLSPIFTSALDQDECRASCPSATLTPESVGWAQEVWLLWEEEKYLVPARNWTQFLSHQAHSLISQCWNSFWEMGWTWNPSLLYTMYERLWRRMFKPRAIQFRFKLMLYFNCLTLSHQYLITMDCIMSFKQHTAPNFGILTTIRMLQNGCSFLSKNCFLIMFRILQAIISFKFWLSYPRLMHKSDNLFAVNQISTLCENQQRVFTFMGNLLMWSVAVRLQKVFS